MFVLFKGEKNMKAGGDLHDSSYLPKATVVIDLDGFTWVCFFSINPI